MGKLSEIHISMLQDASAENKSPATLCTAEALTVAVANRRIRQVNARSNARESSTGVPIIPVFKAGKRSDSPINGHDGDRAVLEQSA
jgi:hypothetical protein